MILLAIDEICRDGSLDAAAGRKLPEHFAVFRVERADLAIVGAAANDQPSRCGEHRSPIRRFLEVMRPYLLTCIDVPGLHLAKMIGGRRLHQLGRPTIHPRNLCPRRR